MFASKVVSSTSVAMAPPPGGFFKEGVLTMSCAETEQVVIQENRRPVMTSDGERYALVGTKVDQTDSYALQELLESQRREVLRMQE